MTQTVQVNQWRVSLSIDGRDLGVWDKISDLSGGSSTGKYSPGGMGPQISFGGRQTTENLTVSRFYELAEVHAYFKWLWNGRGKYEAVASMEPLLPDGTPGGPPDVLRGVLKMVKRGAIDSEGDGVQILEVEIETAGSIG